ncbi:unnamed protein product [Effrenium voratum]|uniref:PDZ domain-containing protein n=1 Tax=Effrenium voratum TaxID=2562239 RepID=A0AA36MP00_9DINO|nr:unnamed protein product [Effrenium voratum]CAJ1379845.1 unnamed protein product [Effrenium voratum]CAJ1438501.1 unnamed protein product [Effrenium voratum]|mmetsp:Transcript_94654/g.225494  ORF Transcript_94654/g.225494 Transcript_94654/m.225494 type:complete len:140 (-) Transcript_94654:194-613(-)
MAFMCCCTSDEGQTVEALASPVERLSDKPKLAGSDEAKEAEAMASPRNDREFEVVIEKSPDDQRIGLDISVVGGKVLKVWKIKDGLVNEWNKTAPPDQQVRSGDAVVAVNGKRGSADQLLEQVSKGRKVTILCSRGMFA